MRPTHLPDYSRPVQDSNNANARRHARRWKVWQLRKLGRSAAARLARIKVARLLDARLLISLIGIALVATILTVTAYMQEGSRPKQKPPTRSNGSVIRRTLSEQEAFEKKSDELGKEEAGPLVPGPKLVTVGTYPFTSSIGVALEDMSSGTTQLVAAGSDDGNSSLNNIGFDFWYDGVRFTSFGVNANGFARLGAVSTGSSFDNASSGFNSTTNAPKIAPYYDDIWVGTNGQVHFKVVGSAPTRKLVVEWQNMTIPRQGAATTGVGTFQMWLFETTGVVQFVYGSGIVTNTDNGGYSVGLQSGAATNFASVTTSGPTVSYATANNTQTNAITSGSAYLFTPNVPTAPTGLNFTAVTALGMTLNWTDTSSNERGFAIYRSDDGGSTYNFISPQTAANATTSVQTGLSAGTTYFWRVFAVTEGALSTALAGSQATTAGTTYTWNQTGTASYATAANWTPTRTTPAASDILVFNNGATTTVTNVTVGQTIGQLSISNNTSVSLQSAATATLTIGGGPGTDLSVPSGSTLQINSPTNVLTLAFSGTQVASIAGTLSITGAANTYNATNSTTTVSGTVNNTTGSFTSTAANLIFSNGSFYNHNFTTGTGAIPTSTWNSGSTVQILGYTTGGPPTGLGQTFSNFTWNCTNQGTTNISLAGATITANGTFTMASTGTTGSLRLGAGTNGVIAAGNFAQTGGILDLSSGAGNGTVRVAGTFNKSGGTLTESGAGTTNTIEFNGTSNQAVTLAGIISNTLSYRINNNAGITLTGTMAITTGASLINSSTAATPISGTVTYTGSTTLVYNATTGAQTATASEFLAASGPTNLTINNTSTSPNNTVTLPFSRSLSGVLTLTAGTLNTTSSNLLTLTNITAGAVSGGSATAYVNGPLARTLPASLASGSIYTFPVGKSAFKLFELVNPTTNAGGTVVVQAEAFDGNSGGTAGAGIEALFTNRYWQASITSGAGNFTNTAVRVTDAPLGSRVAQSATQTGSYASIGGTVVGAALQSSSVTSLGFFAMGSIAISGPISVCDGVTYPTLKSFFDTVNGAVITGNIQVTLNGNCTETATASLNQWTESPANSNFTMTIQPAGARTISGTIVGAIIKLNGADRVTIDGLNSAGNSLAVTNNSTASTSTAIWLASLGAGQGATNDTIRNLTITGGAIGSNSVATFGIIVGSTISLNTFGDDNDNVTIQGNTITKVQNGIYVEGTNVFNQPVVSAGGADNLSILNNIIGPASAGANNIGATGILVQNAVSPNISGNTVRNVIAPVGLTFQGFPAGITLINSLDGVIGQNTVTNVTHPSITNAMYAMGILVDSSLSTNTQITGNTVSNVAATASNTSGNIVSAFGIVNGSPGSQIIGNTVTGVISASTFGCPARGIWLTNAITNLTVANNSVSDIQSYSDPDPQFRWQPVGIYVDPFATNVKLYYNSVNLFDVHFGLTSSTMQAALFIDGTGSETGLDLRDNVLVNTYDNTSSGTDKSYAIYSNALPAAFTNINYNDYFASGPPSVLGAIATVTAGTAVDQTTIGAWRTATGQDLQSFVGDPLFTSTTNLHVTSSSSPVSNTGTPIAAITTDIDGQNRHATTPDVGVDEFTPATITVSGGPLTFPDTAILSTSAEQTYTVSGVFLAANLVVTAPTHFQVSTTSGSGFGTSVSLTPSSGTVPTTTIYVRFAPTTTGPKSGNVTNASTGATTQDLGVSGNAVGYSGTLNVGAGQTFTSLTNNNGLFARINTNGLSGNVTVNITSNLLAESGLNSLDQWTETGVGNYTLTIKPSGAARVIQPTDTPGSDFIRLNGADRVTFDGSLSGGTDRSLTLTNTNTGNSGSTYVFFISSLGAGAGANNVTIKNCIIRGANLGGPSVSPHWGILASTDLGPTYEGPDNDNLTIQNNQIVRATIGLQAIGGPAAISYNDNLVVQGNTIGDAVDSDGIGFKGMVLGNTTGGTVSGNTIQNVFVQNDPAGSPPVGISLESGFINSSVTRNNITNLHYRDIFNFGAKGIYINTGDAASNLTVANNFVFDINGDNTNAFDYRYGTTIGIGIFGPTGGVKLYDNSVNLGSGSFAGAGDGTLSAGLFVELDVTALDIRGNIFATNLDNTGAVGDKTYAIYSDAPSTTFTNINHNDYFASGPAGVLGFIGFSDRTTLANWQAATGQDAQSIAADPQFASATNLHITRTSPSVLSPVENAGVTLAGITTDYEGDTRDASTPEIGADEVTSMQFSSATYSVAENVGGGLVTITVTRTAGSANAATIHYATSDGAAIGGATCSGSTDYLNAAGTLNFAAGETSKTFDVAICNDSTYEGDEEFDVTLDTPGGGSIVGSPDAAVVNITEDDALPSFSIDDVSHNEGNAGTTTYTFTVTKTGATALNSEVDFITVIGTATTADNDYAFQSGTLLFTPAGPTTQQITVLVNGDTNVEPDEAFTVHLSNPQSATISDADGTGTITNDDVSGETDVAVSAGNLVITDANGGTTADTLTISLNVANVRINDPNNTLTAGAGATQIDANTVEVPLASISGNIQVNTLGANDTLTLALAGGDFIPAGGLSYAGGTQTSVPGDKLVITGGAQGTVTYNYTNANDGSIVMSNFGTVTYTGLEPITNTGTAADVIFNLPAGPTAATLSDDGASGNTMSRLSGATFETTDFANPTGSLTVNRGNVADTLAVNALPDFNASLTLGTSVAPFSTLDFNGTVTLAAARNLSGDASSTISLPNATSDLATSGTGTIALSTARNISFASGSSLATVNGNITLNANQQVSPTAGTFTGVDVNNGSVQATGTGVVTVNGRGGNSGAGNIGLLVRGGGTIRGGNSVGVMTTDVLGTGGSGGSNPHGVDVEPSSTITSAGGDVRVRGFAGTSTSANNYGVIPVNGGIITSGGNGNVLVQGTGGTNAGGGNVGVIPHQGGSITSGGTGTVTVTGTGGNGPASYGVQIFRDGRINSGGAGNVAVTGTGGGGSHGVFVSGVDNSVTGARINSGGGTITVTGIPSPGGTGIVVDGGGSGQSRIQSTGNAPITLIADTMTLDSGNTTLNSGTGATTLRQLTNGKIINLGAADSGTQLGFIDNELDRVTSGTLVIGDSNSGAVNVSAVITQTGKTTNINTPGTTTVLSGGSLGITGTINSPLVVNSGGTLPPGTSPGIINSGNVSFLSGSTFAVEIGGTTPGNTATNHDQLNVSGTVSLGNATLSLASFGGFTPTIGQTFVIVNNDGADAVTGTFNGLAEGATITSFLGSVLNATITYAGGTNSNDVVLTAVSPCAPQSTVYVDDSWVGTTPGTDPDAGGPATNFGCDSFATIQDGINGVTSGGTVIVRAGNYFENPNVNKSVSLRGAQFGVDARTRVASESIVRTVGAGQTAVFVVTGVANVTIDGFTIDGDDPGFTGIALASGDDTNASYGVRPTGAVSNLTVSNNIIKKVEIGLRGDVASQGNVINQNLFDSIGHFDFGYAVSIRNNFYANVTNNKMTRVFTGVHANNHNGGGGPAGFNITGNEIHSYAGGILYWLQFNGATGATISGNTITAETGAVANNFGVLMVSIQNAVNPTFTNNTITGHNYGVGLFNVPTTNTITLGATNSITGATLAGVFLTDNLNFNPITTTNFLAGGPGAASTVDVSGMSITGSAGAGLKVEGQTNQQTLNAVSNTVTGFATGVALAGANADPAAHFNRILSTTTAISNADNAIANLENNWWGCNAGPGNAGCGTVTGTGADFDPWIVLLGSAAPNPIGPGGTSTVTADMTHNSAGAIPVGTLPNIPVSYSATNGNMSPASDTIVAGTDTSLFTSNSSNSAVATITVDGQAVNVPITVNAPSFSIDDVSHNEGDAGTTSYTFTITKTGATALSSSVDYATLDSSATSPSDFTAILTTNVVFAAADTTKQFTVLVNGDTAFEPTEQFSVQLSNASGGTISDPSGIGTITNDDACGAFATVYVDDSWVGTTPGTDPDAGGPATSFGCDSFATIQEGVNAVTAGGTVNVAAGNYVENVIIPKALTLTGAGAASVFVYPAISNPNCGGGGGSICAGGSNIMLVQASNVTISGMTLDGDNTALPGGFNVGGANVDARNGIITNHLLATYNNLEVHHTTVKNIYLRGMYASSGGTFNFHHNTIDNVQAEAASIGMFNFGGAGTFDNNTVSSCNDAISSNHSRGVQFTNNFVTASASGIHTDNAGDGGGSADTISGNTVTNSSMFGYGIWVYVPYKTVNVQNNTATNVIVGYASFGMAPGITAKPSQEGEKTQSLKPAPKAFAVSEPATEARLQSVHGPLAPPAPPYAAIFTGNIANGQHNPSSTGVYFTTSQIAFGSANTKVKFFSNTVLNNADGFYLEAETGFTLETAASFNRIIDNDFTAVTVASAPGFAGTLNGSMENNWWGCNAGPNNAGCGNIVGAGVDFDPWIILGISASPATIPPGGSSTITADLTHNSDNAVPSVTDFVPQVAVTFGATNGTVLPTSGIISNGQATTTFTSNSTSSGSASATVDHQTVSTPVNVSAANTYTWTPLLGSTNWLLPTNWSPTRVLPQASDVLVVNGTTTSAPLITNVPTQTIAQFHLINGPQVTLQAGGTSTLTINGATGTDLTVPAGSLLTLDGSNGLTIKVSGLGTIGSIDGGVIAQGGFHRLFGDASGVINFPSGGFATAGPGLTSNMFGTGVVGDGGVGTVIFQSGSTYSHNAGGSPFGTVGNGPVVTFQNGSLARWFTSSGFQASARTYADLQVGDSAAAVSVTDGGSGNFQFNNLTVKSSSSVSSSLTFNGTGASAIAIGGDITSTGIGNGTLPDVNLTPGTAGITINKVGGGTLTFGNDGSNARGIDFEGSGGNVATVSNGTTLALARVLLLGFSNPHLNLLTVDTTANITGGPSGYLVGSLARVSVPNGSSSFPVGTVGAYSPVDLANASGGGSLTVVARSPQQPVLNAGTSLHRYWSLTHDTGALTTDLTFHYLEGDVAGSDTGYQLVIVEAGNATSFPNSCPNTCVDPSANTIHRSGVSSFSDWTAAEPAAPTAVKLVDFNAVQAGNEVMLSWQTGYETRNLGYNVYREQGGRRVAITPSLVAGSALLAGSNTKLSSGLNYTWYDDLRDVRSQKSSVNYWLEDVDINGTRTLHGPIAVSDCASVRSDCKQLSGRRSSRLLSQVSSKGSTDGVQFRGWPVVPATLKQELSGEQTKTPKSVDTDADDLARQQALIEARPGVKIAVSREGWYRVTQPELVAAGLDPDVDATRLQLYVNGRTTPIKLSVAGGRLTSSDYLEFYGQGLQSTTDSAQTYYLTLADGAGSRIRSPFADTLAPPNGPPSFAYTIERKERMIYFSGLLNGAAENFFGQVITAGQTVATIPVSRLDSETTAQLAVTLQGVTSQSHAVRVSLNGNDLGSVLFANTDHATETFNISGVDLLEGDNTIGLTASDGGDVSLVDVIRLTYGHKYLADNNHLEVLVSDGETKQFSGFDNANIRIIDVTSPALVKELTPAANITSLEDGTFAVDVRVPGATNLKQHKVLVFTEGTINTVDSVRANNASSWWSETAGADYLIITTDDLKASVAALSQLRSNQGMAVRVIDVEDLYDEFSFGEHSPQAVRDFLAKAVIDWTTKPRYVVFAGDASYDPKNYLGLGPSDLVPTKLIDTSLSETASDDWLADFNNDGMADFAIGRLPVRTATEMNALVAKIVNYESAAPDPSRGALLVSDNGFEAPSTAVQSLLPAGMTVATINRSNADDATIHNQIIAGINQGPRVINYIGHGSNGVWTAASLLSSNDAPSLTNTNRLSVFTMMTCYNGYFQDAFNDSLSEALLKAPGGAVAVWASTTLTQPAGQNAIDQEFYRMLFGVQPATLGDAARGAKLVTGDVDVRRTWTLFGDPAMRLR
jgi:hypothetical protein